MKCINCGYESETDFEFCPNCGTSTESEPQGKSPVISQPTAQNIVQQQSAPQSTPPFSPVQQGGFGTAPNFNQPQPMFNGQPANYGAPIPNPNIVNQAQNPVAQHLLGVVNDSMFLVICILASAGAVLGLPNGNFNLLTILSAIFLWIVFAGGKKGFVDRNNMRNVSGVVFAQYVIMWVLVGLLALLGIICGALISVTGTEFTSELESQLSARFSPDELDIVLKLLPVSAVVVIIALFIVAACIAIVNVFAYRNIHKFARSLYVSLDCGLFYFEKANTARSWLMVFGVIEALSCVTALTDISKNYFSLLAGLCTATMYILSSVLIGKYFTPAKS